MKVFELILALSILIGVFIGDVGIVAIACFLAGVALDWMIVFGLYLIFLLALAISFFYSLFEEIF